MYRRIISRQLQMAALTGLILSLWGCGTSPRPDFYLLEQAASFQLTGLERGVAIGIGPVNVAPYLDRPQIVTRTGNYRLEMSEFHRWSEPLQVSLSTVIAVNLSNQLKTNRVYLLPRRNKTIPLDYVLAIDVVRFDGELGGEARLATRWSLYGKDGQVILTRVSIISAAVNGSGYEQLVAAENQTLQQLSEEIATVISSN